MKKSTGKSKVSAAVGSNPRLLQENPAPGAKPRVAKLKSSLGSLVSWGTKGGLAILDQGLISGSNFLVSILLARWLTQDAYGAYAIAFGIYIMLALVYQSLVLEPMGVFGGSSFRGNLRGYLRSLISIHVALSATICAAFVVAWFIAHHLGAGGVMTGALAGVAIASPCLMLLSLARRTFYVELSPATAAGGALLYSALVLAGLYFVYTHALLSPFSALLLIAAGALGSGIVLMFALHSGLRGSGPAPNVRQAWHRHWRYGRWALASCIAGWLPSYIYFPLLSSFTGMSASGQLKALMNLTLPFEQVKGALVMLALPYAAGFMDRGGSEAARILGRKLTLLSIVGAVAYWAVIIPLQRPLFHLLYSGRYMEVAYFLPALALGQVFWSGTFGPQVALRAMESPASVFAALGVATALSLLIGVPATWVFGLKGAIWGSNAADVLSFIALLLMLRYKLGSKSLKSSESAPAEFSRNVALEVSD